MEVRVQGKCGPVVNNVDDVCSGKYSNSYRISRGSGWLSCGANRRNSPIWKRRFIEPFKSWRIKSWPGC